MKTKSTLLLAASLLFSVLLSCKNDTNTPLDNDPNAVIVCGTKDPVNDLKWLSDKMKVLEGGSNLNGVVLFEYNNNKVIEIQCSVCSSTNIHQYNCDGTKFDFTNANNFNDYLKNRTKIKILYGTEIWKM